MSGSGDTGEAPVNNPDQHDDAVNPPLEVPSGHVLRPSGGATCASLDCAREGHIACRTQGPAAAGVQPGQPGQPPHESDGIEVIKPPPDEKS